jgi:NADP-dependent 3-hydroxy acid dehydrogenase YdfG
LFFGTRVLGLLVTLVDAATGAAITGANGGLGSYLTQALLDAGATVVGV